LAKAGLALAGMQAVKGRGVRHRLALDDDDFILIDESYNANPTSMRAAIALLAAAKTKGRGRHIAVLGDMLELGPTSSTLHRELAEPLKANEIDRAYLVGPEMKALQEELGSSIETTHGDAIDSLIPLIKQDLRGGDVLMAKASLGIGFAKLIDALTSDYKTIS